MTTNPFTPLLLATHNLGKVREYLELLTDIPFVLTSLGSEGITQDIEETGESFEDNARIKAEAYAKLSGMFTFADDSGLEVDALSGRPGVHSARYGGHSLTDEERVLLLLKNLDKVPWDQRTARFRCVIAISGPGLETKTVHGSVAGIIQYEPRGDNGFGYDPVFFLPSLGRTTAELFPEEKNAISHRGKAARKARSLLLAM